MDNAFDSAIEPEGRYGAVFERDAEAAYFYLLDLERPSNPIIEAFNVSFLSELPEIAPATVAWGSIKRIVGLIVNENPVAIFDLTVPGPHGRSATEEDAIYFRKI